MIKLTRKLCPNPEKLKTDYKNKENKEALKDSSYGKCMYCESAISHIDYGDVEHIKPKSLFPAEKYNWDNLGYACPKCNRECKKEIYDPNIINPYDTDPVNYLYFIGGILRAKNSNNKGRITITIIQLNRPDLLQKRKEALLLLEQLIIRFQTTTNLAEKEALKKLIEENVKDYNEFSACKKAFWENTI
jgi:uncharacterized protein (TIGR02646 family)